MIDVLSHQHPSSAPYHYLGVNMPEATEGDRDGEWMLGEEEEETGADIQVVLSKTDIEDPAREPEEGESVGEYAPDVAGDHGIKKFAIKVGGDDLTQRGADFTSGEKVYKGSRLAQTPVNDLDRTLKIGKYSVLA